MKSGGWPREATLEKIRHRVSHAEYDQIEQALAKQWSDSKALGVIAQVLVGKHGRDALIIELISTHTATRIVFIWIRTSPDEVIYFVETTGETTVFVEKHCDSQQKRVAMGFELFEQHTEGDALLYPDMFVLEGVSGYSTLPSESNGRAFTVFTERISALSSAVPNKLIHTLALDLNRFHRVPRSALSMLNDLEQEYGVKPMFMKHLSTNIVEVVRHYSEYNAELDRIKAIATNVDAAKGLKQTLHAESPYFKALQEMINSKSDWNGQGPRPQLQVDLLQAGSAARIRLEKAVANGHDLLKQCVLYDAVNKRVAVQRPEVPLLADIANQLLKDPSKASHLADEFLSLMNGRFANFNEQSADMMYIRASKSAENGDGRIFVNVDDTEVALEQAAKNFVALDTLGTIDAICSLSGCGSNVQGVQAVADAVFDGAVAEMNAAIAAFADFLGPTSVDLSVALTTAMETGDFGPVTAPMRAFLSDNYPNWVPGSCLQSDDAVFALVGKRNRITMHPLMVATAELVSRRALKSLIFTQPPRLSGWEGWISFFNELSDRCGTRFEMSDAVGVSAMDVSRREQMRRTGNSAASATLHNNIAPAEDDVLGNGFRMLAFSK